MHGRLSDAQPSISTWFFWRFALRRVVVTGMGMVTPLGSGVDHNWSQIIAGKSGIWGIECL